MPTALSHPREHHELQPSCPWPRPAAENFACRFLQGQTLIVLVIVLGCRAGDRPVMWAINASEISDTHQSRARPSINPVTRFSAAVEAV